MSQLPEITYVAYRQEGELPRKAAFIPVEVSLEGLSDVQIQILGHLMDAVNAINPVFQDQFDVRTLMLRQLVKKLIPVSAAEERQLLEDYLHILDLQNGPYAMLPRKNHMLDIPPTRLRSLAEAAGCSAPEELEQVLDLFTEAKDTPRKANFYPQDLTESEFKSLGKAAYLVNSSVRRAKDGSLQVVLNEETYRKQLAVCVEHLRAARELVEDRDLHMYIDAKIVELEFGSEEARRIADYIWIKQANPIDFVLSSAIEVYTDDYKNIRGAAAGGVYVRNSSAEALLQALIERVPRFESEAPWSWKRENIDPATLPRLKFVDVLAWSGDYIGSPNTTLAQSLPNDAWISQNIGTVNMVYSNTTRAIYKVGGRMLAIEMLPSADFQRFNTLLFDADQLHSALHEIGHTTGSMDPDHSRGQPSDYLEDEYSWLEETRAELFGIWALELLEEDGVIDRETLEASHATFLLTMLGALRFEPVQAHTSARNAIFHQFEQAGVIELLTEDDRTCFRIQTDRVHAVVCEMLKTIADLKATGDKAGTMALREALVYPDPLQKEIEQRTADLPLGRGLIFPALKRTGDTYMPELVYPANFSEQSKFNSSVS